MTKFEYPVTLPGDPTTNLHAATKRYVDTQIAAIDIPDPSPGGGTTVVYGTQFIDKVLTYFGTPSAVNAAPDLEVAASSFGAYNKVIFGAGLEELAHSDHAYTIDIISYGQQYGTKFYGYINTGVTSPAPNYSLSIIADKITKWFDMGVAGIYLDNMDTASGVTRSRMNSILDNVHAENLHAIIHASDIDNVLSLSGGTVAVDPEIDYMYLQFFTLSDGSYTALSDMESNAQALKSYNVPFIAGNTLNHTGLSAVFKTNYYRQAQAAAFIYRASGIAIDSVDYSATSGVNSNVVNPFSWQFNVDMPLNTQAYWYYDDTAQFVYAQDLGLKLWHGSAGGHKVEEFGAQRKYATHDEFVAGTNVTLDNTTNPGFTIINSYAGDGGGGGGGGPVENPDQLRFLIVTEDEPDLEIRAAADLYLGDVPNQAAAIQAAFDANDYIQIIGPSIEPEDRIHITKTIDILANGTLIKNATKYPWKVASPSYVRKSPIAVYGTRTALTVTPAKLSTDLVKGSNRIVFATGGRPSAVVVGDWIQIRSNETAGHGEPADKKGEFVQVIGLIGADTWLLSTGLYDSYLKSQIAEFMKIGWCENVVIDGLKFTQNTAAFVGAAPYSGLCSGTDSTGTSYTNYDCNLQDAINFAYCKNLTIRNCEAYGNYLTYGFVIATCMDVICENLYVKEIYDSKNPGSSGYGYAIQASQNVFLTNCDGERCRHLTDCGGRDNYLFPPRNVTYRDCVARGTYSNGFATHNSEHIRYINCTALNCGGGFQIRGANFVYENCSVYGIGNEQPPIGYSGTIGGNPGIAVGEGAQGIKAGNRLIVTNFVMESIYTGAGEAHGMRVEWPLTDAFIQMTYKGGRQAFVAQQSDSTRDLWIKNSIIDITIDGSNQGNHSSGAGMGVFSFRPSTTSNEGVSNSTIRINGRNTTSPALLMYGANSGTGLQSRNNVIDVVLDGLGVNATASSPQVVFGTGQHGKHLIERLVLPDTNEANAITTGTATIVKNETSGLFYYKP